MSKVRRRAVAGLAAALAIAGAAAVFLARRDTTPLLTPQALAAAREKWQKAAIADYELTLRQEFDARPAEILQTEARGGKVTRLAVGGSPVAPRNSCAVPDLFDLLDTELEMAASKQPAPGQPRNAILKAHFHPVLGIPLVIKRLAPRRQSYVLRVLHVSTPDQPFLWKEP